MKPIVAALYLKVACAPILGWVLRVQKDGVAERSLIPILQVGMGLCFGSFPANQENLVRSLFGPYRKGPLLCHLTVPVFDCQVLS